MYVAVLSDAVRASDTGLTGATLVDHAVTCRVHLLTAPGGANPSAYDLLALDVAYDVSLIRLCAELGVRTEVANFASPLTERSRIERVLAESHGLDLTALARSYRPS